VPFLSGGNRYVQYRPASKNAPPVDCWDHYVFAKHLLSIGCNGSSADLRELPRRGGSICGYGEPR